MGCPGYSTRYWDCCKAHCSWQGNVPSGVDPLPACSASDAVLSDVDAGSSCDAGGAAHMCQSMAPWVINENLAYGFAAAASGDVCGRCYELRFTGSSYNGGDDPGSAALAGKRMIVQTTNIGYDVSGGQFDILVPGGGVGAFNACSDQWGVPSEQLGAQYGGLLAACKQKLGWNDSLDSYKNCLAQSCQSVFGSRGLSEAYEGCMFYVDWFQAADNPALDYREVPCPNEITVRSGVDRGFLNDVQTSCF
ncbi:Glycosyl hydrolase family 45 [Alteromonadaceae bacterium Bs31]|nr:Glycosyl hydrolase family 45 [Alteromonadaceae bacterium Bs31]